MKSKQGALTDRQSPLSVLLRAFIEKSLTLEESIQAFPELVTGSILFRNVERAEVAQKFEHYIKQNLSSGSNKSKFTCLYHNNLDFLKVYPQLMNSLVFFINTVNEELGGLISREEARSTKLSSYLAKHQDIR